MRRAAIFAALLVASAWTAGAQVPAMPEGCEGDEKAVTCQWRFDTRQGLGQLIWEFALPAIADGFATVVVLLDGADGGWSTYVLDEEGRRTSMDTHEADRQPGSTRHRDSYSLVVNVSEARTFRISTVAQSIEVQGATVNNAAPGGASSGLFTVTWHIEAFPEGVAPIRPAATREDPHLAAQPRDARQGASDLVAAWMDDAFVGDARFEMHVAVADAQDWAWRTGGEYLRYHYAFDLALKRYQATWSIGATQPLDDIEDVGTECFFGAQNEAGNFESLVDPRCEIDWGNGTLSMSVPAAILGDPSGAALFTGMSAEVLSGSYHGPTGTYSTSLDTVDDQASGERYPFALGGPDVWDELNPRLAVRAPPVAPFYEEPLAPANIPDTLQVAGALLGLVTFVAGFVVVRRHRRLTRQLIARIDELTALHEDDARRGLLALGQFESEVAALYREKALTDAQYQLVTQRVSAAATRLGFRHNLGLDDGEPR